MERPFGIFCTHSTFASDRGLSLRSTLEDNPDAAGNIDYEW